MRDAIVDQTGHHEQAGAADGDGRPAEPHPPQAGNRRRHDGDGGERHQPLVGLAPAPLSETRAHQDREHQQRAERDREGASGGGPPAGV